MSHFPAFFFDKYLLLSVSLRSLKQKKKKERTKLMFLLSRKVVSKCFLGSNKRHLKSVALVQSGPRFRVAHHRGTCSKPLKYFKRLH